MRTSEPTSNPRAGMPVVELHGFLTDKGHWDKYGPGNIGQKGESFVNVTRFCTQVSWMHSTQEPWETIRLSLALPWRDIPLVLPGFCVGSEAGVHKRHPLPGFWVVIRLGEKSPAVAWGRVVSVTTGRTTTEITGNLPAGFTQTVPVQITCESWLGMLGKSRVVIAPGAGAALEEIGEGFIYTLKTWNDKIQAIMERSLQHFPGVLLEDLWDNLVPIYLPNSLAQNSTGAPYKIAWGGEPQIPIVHNDATCQKFAPFRILQHRPIPGEAINSFGNAFPRGTIWSWLASTFQADPQVVELFPSLEYPVKKPFDRSLGKDLPTDGTIEFTEIGEALGAQPVLMYRHKPFLLLAVNQVEGTRIRKAEAARNPHLSNVAGKAYENVPVAQQLAEETQDGTTWGQDPVSLDTPADLDWYDFPLHEIVSIQLSWDDKDRINACYIKTPLQPTTQMELYGLMGIPIVNQYDLNMHGLRMYDTNWPFLPSGLPGQSADSTASLHRKLTALCDIFYPLVGCLDSVFFARAQLSVLYKPWIKAGFFIMGELPTNSSLGSMDGADADTATKDEKTQTQGFTGYIDAVTHSIQVLPDGKIKATTQLKLSRVTILGAGLSAVPFPLRSFGIADKAFILDAEGRTIWGDIRNGEFVEDPGFTPSE